MTKISISCWFLIFSILIVWLVNGCTSALTPAPVEPPPTSAPTQTPTLDPNMPLPTAVHYTLAEAEKLAGFDVKEPTYLPKGVSLDFATYQKSPQPNVTLHFKIVHETYGDMGAFFQIVQELKAVPASTTCGAGGNSCEVLQVGDLTVEYYLTSPTESLTWNMDRFSFLLTRTAGEPNKLYKDELVKVVSSMK